jgi:uncharacterized protein YfbU (UPF0304 family)
VKLSPSERLILSNLFELRAVLDDANAERWKNMAEIVAHGYEILFGELPRIDKLQPEDRGRFVVEVLDLYRLLHDYVEANPKDTEVCDHEWSRFRGFAGVEERDLLALCRFLVVRQRKWPEQAANEDDLDSRTPTVKRYERMLAAWRARGAPTELSSDDVRAVLDPKKKRASRRS